MEQLPVPAAAYKGKPATAHTRQMLALLTGQLSATEMLALGADAVSGSPLALARLLGTLRQDDRYYPMVPMPG